MKFKLLSLALLIALPFVWQCQEAPRCNDGRMNGDEEFVDCGGSCGPCFTCNDGFKNQGETLTDCGGYSCDFCPEEWQPLKLPQGVGFVSVFAKNEQEIFGLSAVGAIARSTDGGKTWSMRHEAFPEGGNFTDIHFFDDLHGIAIGAVFSFGSALGVTLSTSDGGQFWFRHDVGFSQPQKVTFKPPQTVYVYDGTFDLKVSHDGGIGFLPIDPGMFPGIPLDDLTRLAQCYFFGPEEGYALVCKFNNVSWFEERCYLYKTTDGGASWSFHADIGQVYSFYFRMFTPQVMTTTPYSDPSTFILSTDGGQNWAPFTPPSSFFIFTNATTGYALPNEYPPDLEHYAYKTIDGGASWQPFGLMNQARRDNYEFPFYNLKLLKKDRFIYAWGGSLLKLEEEN